MKRAYLMEMNVLRGYATSSWRPAFSSPSSWAWE